MKAVLALDVYQPGQWHDFLVVAGGGAAAMTGLVFVALSLNLNVVTQDATLGAEGADARAWQVAHCP
jgi:hypothetical protein